jgi:hypothetical protein
VSFHFSDDGTGSDIVFIEGEAAIDPTLPTLPEHKAYVDKYAVWIVASYHSPERFAERYNVPIVIRPTRGRSPY